MSKKDLQAELSKRGLPKSGNKAVLIQRLQDVIMSDDHTTEDSQHANYEVIQLDIVDAAENPQALESAVSSLEVDYEGFKQFVHEELCNLREQIRGLTDRLIERDDEIKSLKSTPLAKQSNSFSDKSTQTPPWPWQSPCNASTRELATHREIPKSYLPLANRFEVLQTLQENGKKPANSRVEKPASVIDTSTRGVLSSPSATPPCAPIANTRVEKPASTIDTSTREVLSSSSAPPGAPIANTPVRPDAFRASSEATPVAMNIDTPAREVAPAPITMAPSTPVRPGLPTYSNTASGQSTTLILADSMMNGVRQDEIDQNIGGNERAILKKFGGATARELEAYAEYNIERYRPKQLIIIVGTNDLAQRCRDGMQRGVEPNPEEISEDIMRIARNAREKGIERIYVSGIIYRRWSKYRDLRTNVNGLVMRKCHKEGFYFLEQDNIESRHLANDGLHLNPAGSKYLKQNILRFCFDSFNPYLCDFNFWYDYSNDRGFQLNGRFR